MPSCNHHEICGLTDEADPATGMCILHSKDPGKDKQAFGVALEAHRKSKGDRFVLFVFPENMVLDPLTFPERADFSFATFLGDANFNGVQFEKGVNFFRCTFEKDAVFEHSWFRGENPAEFYVCFNEATFTKRARFLGVRLTAEASFMKAKFKEGADFTGAWFGEHSSFREAECAGEMNFASAVFHKGADFNKSIFDGVAVFQQVHFQPEETTFVQTIFKEKPDFILAHFYRPAEFRGATFAQGADFCAAKFHPGIDFSPAFEEPQSHPTATAVAMGRGRIIRTSFLGDTDFTEAVFGGVVNFHQAYMDGRMVFKSLHPTPIFQGTDVTFREVTIGPSGAIEFSGVDLSKCQFLDTDLRKIQITRAIWARIPNRLGNRFPSREGIYDGIVGSRADAGYPWEGIERAYRELKQNHEERRDYERAGDFHYGEKEMRRRNPKTPWVLRTLLTLYWLLSGYGERYLRPLIWAGILLLLSAIGYLTLGLRVKEDGGKVLAMTNCWDWFRSIFFSFRVMTLLKPEDLTPIRYAKIVHAFQSLLGPVFIGLFALALRQKLKR